MVVHQDVRVQIHTVRFEIVLKLLEEAFSFPVLPEYAPPAVTSAADVIHCPAVFDSRRPTHTAPYDNTSTLINPKVNI